MLDVTVKSSRRYISAVYDLDILYLFIMGGVSTKNKHAATDLCYKTVMD